MKKIMKRNYKVLSFLLLLAFASCSFTSKKFSNPDKDKLLIQIITFVIEQGHFDPIAIDDAFSEELFSDFIEVIDPVKRYFYESDYKDFEKYKLTIDDQLKVSDITFFNVVYERFISRIEESKSIYKDILSKPFDYSIDESTKSSYFSMIDFLFIPSYFIETGPIVLLEGVYFQKTVLAPFGSPWLQIQ